ncbi:MAG: DUF3365 domain-containing protein [Flavobacteriales bacterium]|nr:DUF3365 domain-containing protein [Flavobacteriales bacterium]
MIKNILAIAFLSSSILMSCNSNDTKKADVKTETINVADSTVIKEGKKIAMGTFKILGSKLKMAIKSGGPIAGIDVCSSEAMKLTDSLSNIYNLTLKRTSLKYRNEENAPNSSEKIILENWQTQLDGGNPIKPSITRNDGEITFVGPIKLKQQCIVCHGSDDFVTPDVRLKLKEHYPTDLARDYKEGDLRGAWVITFPKDYFSSK